MALEPPDPLTIAAKLRDIYTSLDAQRQACSDLVNAYPTNAAYADAYRQASAACTATKAAADDLDPPR